MSDHRKCQVLRFELALLVGSVQLWERALSPTVYTDLHLRMI